MGPKSHPGSAWRRRVRPVATDGDMLSYREIKPKGSLRQHVERQKQTTYTASNHQHVQLEVVEAKEGKKNSRAAGLPHTSQTQRRQRITFCHQNQGKVTSMRLREISHHRHQSLGTNFFTLVGTRCNDAEKVVTDYRAMYCLPNSNELGPLGHTGVIIGIANRVLINAVVKIQP